jgi:(heptosyl)LPS beta-1,4-glucosyltransferase
MKKPTLPRCLESLQWIDEVLVLDSGSTDRTPQVAQSYHNTKFIKVEWQGYAATKQLGVGKAKHDVIFLGGC